MEIRLDGEDGLLSPTKNMKLGKLFDEIDTVVRSLGREVTKLVLDGNEVGGSHQTDLEQIVDDFELLDVSTTPRTDLVTNLLEATARVMPQLHKILPEAASHFRRGQPTEGAAHLKRIVDALALIQSTLSLAKDLRLVKGDDENAGEATTNQALSTLTTHLQELNVAYKNQDMVTVADVLEYELPEVLVPLSKILTDLGNSLDELGASSEAAESSQPPPNDGEAPPSQESAEASPS